MLIWLERRSRAHKRRRGEMVRERKGDQGGFDVMEEQVLRDGSVISGGRQGTGTKTRKKSIHGCHW